MKNFALMLFLCGTVFSVQAAPVPCNDFVGPVAINESGSGGLQFDCGGPLSFQDFLAYGAAGDPDPQIDLVNVSLDALASLYTLNFNPNMSAPPGSGFVDSWLFFNITGPLTSVGLRVGGVNATIEEVACASATSPTSPVCSTADVLATLLAFSAPGINEDSAIIIRQGNTTWIGKDIGVSDNGGGSLTMFTQSFGYEVPEPMSLLLTGAGLIGLVMYRRRCSA